MERFPIFLIAVIFLFSDTLTVCDFLLQWQDEDSDAGYLVQPVGQAEVLDARGSDMEPGNEEDDPEGEEEVDDDELQVLPSSPHLKRKRDDDEGEDDDDDVVEYMTKSSKKHH